MPPALSLEVTVSGDITFAPRTSLAIGLPWLQCEMGGQSSWGWGRGNRSQQTSAEASSQEFIGTVIGGHFLGQFTLELHKSDLVFCLHMCGLHTSHHHSENLLKTTLQT